MITPLFLFALGLLFVSMAFAAGWVALEVLHRSAPARQRLRGLGDGASVLATSMPLATDELDPRLARASRFLPKSTKDMSRLQKQMARAGFRGPVPAILYTITEFGLPLLLLGICVYFLGTKIGLIVGVLLGIMAFMMPSFWLSFQISKRQKLIANGLPDALDLLIVCVEAGMGLDQGIAKAAAELVVSHPALSEELITITTEIRAGKARLEAFRNFAERTKVDDVRQLVSMLVQTDRFGTSVSQALRTQAEVSRTMRRQRAEERAAKLGVKLVFPLVFCLFPAMYVVTLGPAVIKFVRFFAGTN
jgi:tight adherence protein C